MPHRTRTAALALAVSFVAVPALRAQTPTTPHTPTGPAPPDSLRSGVPQDTMRGHTRRQGLGAATGSGATGDTALVAQLDSVDTAAKAGLTTLPTAAAVALIERIESQLRGERRPALRSIARDLSALRAELGAERVDGRRVGVILRRIGPKVTTVARTQSGPVRGTLQSIGQELATAGQQLVSGATLAPGVPPR